MNIKSGNGIRDVLFDGQCDRECTDKDGCLCPNGCEIERNKEVSEGSNCGGDKKDHESVGFVETESGCNEDTWKNICFCQSGQDGIYCFNDGWVCTTDANQDDPTYHSLEEC